MVLTSGQSRILDAVPPATLEQVERDFLAMQKVAEQNGVTSVQDMAVSADDTDGPVRLQAI